MVDRLKRYTGLKSVDDYVGLNMDSFHPGYEDRVRNTLLNYQSFPYETTISLFDKYTASIVVNPYEVDGERLGYILTWNDVTEYEAELRNSNHLLEEMYAPVLDTYLDDVLLVPIVGTLTEPRILKMKEKILEECEKRRATEVIFDYTGVRSFDEIYIVKFMKEFEISLSMLGVECINSGMRAKVASQLGEHPDLPEFNSKFFSSLKHAMKYCMKIRGLDIMDI